MSTPPSTPDPEPIRQGHVAASQPWAELDGLEGPAPDPSLRFVVVHEDRRFVVIEKPAGMLSVPGNGESKQACVASQAAEVFRRATGPMICHRLDMATSGLMVLALDPDAHRFLSNQFERRRIDKRYTAIVHGHVPEDRGVISLPMRPHWPSRPRQIIDFQEGKDSITRFTVLARTLGAALLGPVTRLDLEPVTGRTHQLRVHLAAPRDIGAHLTGDPSSPGGLGAPIVGDRLYGSLEYGRVDSAATDPTDPHDATDAAGLPDPGDRLLLHASRLAFADPATRRPVAFESQPPF